MMAAVADPLNESDLVPRHWHVSTNPTTAALKDFGIVYPGKQDDLIRDDVLLKLSLKAPRKKG